ncbi:MAG: xylulokinase [Brachymonas sp.]|nr:xylulokinase [Brachymonas sp.]
MAIDSNFLGLDLGTSELKAVIINGVGEVLFQASASVASHYPFPLASEQSPHDWWIACQTVCQELRKLSSDAMDAIAAVGLSGHMHGATLVDEQGQVLRPCMMWNDGRSTKQCIELQAAMPEMTTITGNLAMPGFTAPKLMWVRENEPEIFARIAKVLLPKDYLRYVLCGNFVSEMSDAAGTLWLDVRSRQWSDVMLRTTGLDKSRMPDLVEGNEVSGYLNQSAATALGLRMGIPVAGGAGDNAASAVGLGATQPGDAFVSLGTSGVVFSVTAQHQSNTADAVHAFCHALPDRWHHMAVMLSAASCMRWLNSVTGHAGENLMSNEAAELSDLQQHCAPIFLPYLSGERTPHNSTEAAGCFIGLRAIHSRSDLTYAVMEGVAFGLLDGLYAMKQAGSSPKEIQLVGGGARSHFWAQLIADALNLPVNVSQNAMIGAALGAARLALLCTEPKDNSLEAIRKVCSKPETHVNWKPNKQRHQALMSRYELFKQAYLANRALFGALSQHIASYQ